MPPLPTLAVILPCLDRPMDIDSTLRSLAAQAGPFRLQCHAVLGQALLDQAALSDPDRTAENDRQLGWWQKQFAEQHQPIECAELRFSYHTATNAHPKADLVPCLHEGFARCNGADLFGWMMPGDLLQAGALLNIAEAINGFPPEQVSWLSCAEVPPLPQAALRAGLCDGIHWASLPAAGTFFRPWLWQKAAQNPGLKEATAGAATRALWHQLSQNASLVQIPSPQAIPRRPAPVPEATDLSRSRLDSLGKDIPAGQALTWRSLRTDPDQNALVVTDEDARLCLPPHLSEMLPAAPTSPFAAKELFRIPRRPALKSLDEVVSHHKNIFAYDDAWQYPAITEQHAFHQLSTWGAVPDGVTYVAYPWATLIDKIHRKSADLDLFLDRFHAFCAQLPKDSIKVTCCQHIKMKDELDLLRRAGISDIFWTHCTHEDIASETPDGLRLHPFPLFPVQAAEEAGQPRADDSAERPHLFSFIGARANQHYLTNSRNWILDLLSAHPRGQIIGRNSWHYNKVVYDHQVGNPTARREAAQGFVDGSASEQFRASLRASVFSLCPSGTGPNSIRLWESLGLGSIPVILADSWAPPGNPDLWQAGAIFCAETPEAIRALPDRLEALADDADALARLRHGAQQLWALYGPHSFVYDLQNFMIEAADGPQRRPCDNAIPLLFRLAQDVTAPTPPTTTKARLFLSCLANQMLLDEADGAPLLKDAEAQARQVLEPQDPVLEQLGQVQQMVQRRAARRPSPQANAAAPALNRNQPIRVCLLGKHANRTPLAYAPFRNLAADRVILCPSVDNADVVVTGFNADLRDHGEQLRQAQTQRPNLRVAVISEEPLWDSIWSGDLMPRQRQMALPEGALDYSVFNHSNSDIFTFDTIPYFLLTRSDFQARYGLLLARHADLSPQALLQHWNAAPVPAAFYAEVRENPAYSKTWPEQQVEGLSVYRTDVARGVDLPGTLREGQGWRPGAKRQALPDWHLDKIAALDMRTRVVSAYENTHQKNYISEKVFDAFVVGGIPTAYAGPDHRLHDLIPEAAMLNTYGLDAQAAACRIATFTPDMACAEAWLETARRLQARFTDLAAITQERRRITDLVLSALESCLS